MKIHEQFSVPTGDILVVQGKHGLLECLSIGDYGKEVNLKCDAMGLTRNPEPVLHTQMLPLEEKWVVTISTQYGCSIGCKFCDVPHVGPGRNATVCDMIDQINIGLGLHPEVNRGKRLNIHYARMGEPTFNPSVLIASNYLWEKLSPRFDVVHQVVSTMMPKNNHNLSYFIHEWMWFKNAIMDGDAGLQLSINSTNEKEREEMFNGNACSLEDIAKIVKDLDVLGRKITLNFAVAGYEIDPYILLKYFDPDKFICKLTPMHKTFSCNSWGIETCGDYTTYHPYTEYEETLKKAGYDVLVFIASRAEDEGRITCGNALLSGTRPFDTIPIEECV